MYIISTNGWSTIPLTKLWAIRIWQKTYCKKCFCTLPKIFLKFIEKTVTNSLLISLVVVEAVHTIFDNEHTVYETVKVGEADGVLGTSTDEHGKNVYTLSWEYQGITHTVMGNIPYDEIMKIAEGIR